MPARGPSGLYLAVKRLIDVVVSLTGLVVLSPVLAFAAIGTWLTSGRPVLFSQERAGRNGRRFIVWKFRTMRAGRSPDPKEIVPLSHPDVTPFGRLLRRTKIDELPQIVNVLRGDMSLIGPRPTLPDQVERYDDFQRQRLLVRPGCTGLAQVHGNAALSWPERIQYDVYYAHHCGFALDVWILARTVAVIVLGEARFARRFEESRFAGRSDEVTKRRSDGGEGQ